MIKPNGYHRETVAHMFGVSPELVEGSTVQEMISNAKSAQASIAAGVPTRPAYASLHDTGDHSVRTRVDVKAGIMSIKDDHERLKAIRENIDLFR